MPDPRYRVPDGTLPLLSGLLEMMDFTHRNMTHIVADLPSDALAWHPGPEMGSLSGIVRHAMYCEIYAICRAAGEDIAYDEATNAALWDSNDDAPQLIACINEGDAVTKRILPAMTVEKMALRYPAWNQAAPTFAGALIAEAAIHTGMHWGHMQMTRQLWEQAHPGFIGTYTPW